MIIQRLLICLVSQSFAHMFEPALGATFTEDLISGNLQAPFVDSSITANETQNVLGDTKPSALETNKKITPPEPTSDLALLKLDNSAPVTSGSLETNGTTELQAKEQIQKNSTLESPTKTVAEGPKEVPFGTIIGALALMSIVGFFVVKLKKNGVIGIGLNAKRLQIIETLALGPKRHIFLIQVQGQQLLLGSTEGNLQLLKDFSPSLGSNQVNPSLEQIQSNESKARADRDLSYISASLPAPSNASQTTKNSPYLEETPSKQMMLSNALGNLRKRAASVAGNHLTPKQTQETKVANPDKVTNQVKVTSQGKENTEAPAKQGHFPKYLANAFAQESSRFSDKSNDDSFSEGQFKQEKNEDHQLENVTNMIRAKLKEMKPLA